MLCKQLVQSIGSNSQPIVGDGRQILVVGVFVQVFVCPCQDTQGLSSIH